jgi:hypothetical protein
MPCSSYEFQDLYRTLNEGNTDPLFPADLTSPEDAFLLLMAILSDALCLRQSLGRLVADTDSTTRRNQRHNPFVPLSPHTELDRIQSALSSALDRWHLTFHTLMPPEVMAFYHYCKLYLSCFQLLELPRIVRYRMMSHSPIGDSAVSVPQQSIHHAWLVLDNAAARSKSSSSDTLCPAWLPIVVFHASLVIWAKQRFGTIGERKAYSSTKVLLPFKIEIEGMPWPCCKEMAATLDRLMDDTPLA